MQVKGYTMDPQLFTRGFAEGHGPCRCNSVCCEGGVYADVLERDRILAHKEMVKKYMDETQTQDDRRWFEPEPLPDGDFLSGQCVGTELHGDKCVFLDGQGRCSLQVGAVGEGLDRWAIKPMYCVLFPIEITGKTVSFDDMLQGEQACCSVDTRFDTPVFRACRDELVFLVGEDGYAAMEAHYDSLDRAGTEAGRK
jgi:Fe-S-cluster containining protein